jgi:hypothetical protein
MQLQVARSFAGPPNMGHGGYVAGLLASHLDAGGGAIQVTLRRPVPLDTPLDLVEAAGRAELRRDDELIVEADTVDRIELDVPPAPSVEDAHAAESRSPSFFNDGRGVHPICFGCGAQRDGGDGLRVFAGPVEVDGRRQVAGVWRPGSELADASGAVAPLWVLAALDCPGAFAYIVDDQRAGLLGRIVFQLEPGASVAAGADHVVTGWQIEVDGRKMFAGTALHDADGRLLAAAKATWFGRPGS